jgi:F-type H+-transporting ATPase subunit b
MPRLSPLVLGLLTLALAFGPSSRPAFAADNPPEHAGAEAGAEGGHGNPNILEAQPSLAIYTVIVFVLLLLVLWKFAWGPLSVALHKREEQMEHTLQEAERAREESAKLLAQHREQMNQAAEQARAILDEARKGAQATAEEILKKAQAEADASLKRAEREIGTARDQALMEIWDKTADLAVTVAGKVLHKELGPDDQRRLVSQAMAELPSKANGQGGHA